MDDTPSLQQLAALPKSRRVEQRPDLSHRMIGGPILLQTDMVNIGGCELPVPIIGLVLLMDASLYHHYDGRRRGFLNRLLGDGWRFNEVR